LICFQTASIGLGMVFALASACHASGTFEQRRACRADAFKFCGGEIPDVDRITVCMTKNIKKLSPLCRTQFKS
jgi:hypothetical protein